MTLKEFAKGAVNKTAMDKTAIGPLAALLPAAARAVPAIARGVAGIFGRKAATTAVTKAPGLGSKVMSGLNTAGNASMIGSALKPAEKPRTEWSR